ncbi:interferon-inducible GTPase 5-like [Fundulus diaphanus]
MEGPLDRQENERIREMLETDPVAAIKRIISVQTDDIRLNIAIIGEPGTGKSTFVNAFRGINNNDEGAAPTGCGGTTTSPTSYLHPDYPHVILWDLPGIGSTMWPADEYVERVELKKFDFFIIISANRFRENDVKLAKEIQKMGKKVYFVRSKINHNLSDEERSHRDSTEERSLAAIIEDCFKGLQKVGTESPQVFLLSSPDLRQHGLQQLKSTFEGELPELKRKALCLSISDLYLHDLDDKKQRFQAEIKYYCIFSAAVPIPLLSAFVDLWLIYLVFQKYVVGFRLNTPSLEEMAAVTTVPCEDVRITRTLFKPLTTYVVLKSLTQVANRSMASVALMKGYNFISLFRRPVVFALSFTTTYIALRLTISALAEKARRFKRILGLNTM